MVLCEKGKSVIPDFRIYPAMNSKGKDVLAVSVSNLYQELNIEQAWFLMQLLEDWITWPALKKQMEKGITKTDLHSWNISTKVNKTGKKVLAVKLPRSKIKLNMSQVSHLIVMLDDWLDQQKITRKKRKRK